MILKQNKLNTLILCDLRLQKKSNPIGLSENLKKLSDAKRTQLGIDLYKNLSCLKIEDCTENEITTSIENLERLGILLIEDVTLIHKDYSPFENCKTYINNKKNVKYFQELAASESFSLDQKVKNIYLESEFALIAKSAIVTNLGKSFIEICVL
ncbi:hypothetical protein SDC9_143037 [bioreactor metagenome]|uniref:Uncharacterized protein n=2 Tax=root TaxID=1 RepID=A0A645E2V1_9ZZZZ